MYCLSFSYHQKVAYDPPELEIKDKTFGLVSPEAFELPAMSPLWTAVAYASFDTALTDKEKKKQVSTLLFICLW